MQKNMTAAVPPLFVAQSPRRILVFRALQLGDMLCAVPALRALRRALPRAHITLCGLPWAVSFVARFPDYLDDFMAFPGFPGLPEREYDQDGLVAFFDDVIKRRFDAVIQMHGSGAITNPLTAAFGARMHAGFYREPGFRPDPTFAFPYPEREPEIWRCLHLVMELGAEAQGEHLEFPLHVEDYRSLAAYRETRGLKARPYACLHAGARSASRRWPAANFAVVGDALAERGYEIVLTGNEMERDLADVIAKAMRHGCRNLAGAMPLGPLAALVHGASLVVCNDTGVSHLAAALGVPSVVVFNRSEQEGWPPLDRQRHRVICRIGGVETEDVLTEAFDLLAHGRSLRIAVDGDAGPDRAGASRGGC